VKKIVTDTRANLRTEKLEASKIPPAPTDNKPPESSGE
jgi:hypothetical protein